jgi:DNA-binding CsgD family transcriptional regulator
MKLTKNITRYFLLFLISFQSLFGQIKDIGLPFIENFARDDYQAGTQNWAIAQDQNGVMYFANNAGLLVFNGNKWILYPLPNNSVVRSVAYLDNRVYVGGYDEFGYFEENEIGELQYNSFTQKLLDKDKSLGEVWRIHFTRYGVVFQSFLKIIIIFNNKIDVVSASTQFGFSYMVDNNLFIPDRDKGLFILRNKELVPYYDNTSFFKENEITFIISRGTDKLLIGTTNNGIFSLNNKKLTAWDSPINKQLKTDQIYTAIELPNRMLAVGSIQNGLYVINSQEKIVQHVNRYKGIQNNTVLSLFYDKYGNLWLGLDNGIDMLEVSSPLTTINYCFNIEASYCSVVHNGILYIGTNQGLFAKKYDEVENNFSVSPSFILIEGTMGQVWNLKVIDNELFCGHNMGTFIVKGLKAYQITDIQGGWDYVKLKKDDKYIVGGTYTGLILFKKTNSSPAGWEFERKIAGFNESCKEIMLDTDGAIWITHGYKGLYRVILSENYTQVINATLYNATNGLPELPYSLATVRDQLVYVTSRAIYQYNKPDNKFLKNDKLNNVFSGISGFTKIIEDYRGDLWYFTTGGMGVMRLQEDGSYSKITLPFMRIKNQYLVPAFENVYVHSKNIVFISSQRGTIHYDPSIVKDFTPHYKSFIGTVVIKSKDNDSLISFKRVPNKDSEDELNLKDISYRYNSVAFGYFSPFFEAPEQETYSYRLIGFNNNWSDWSQQTVKEYTNLHEGDYVFEVKAKNIYDCQSEVARFTFTIKPPAHRTRFAYISYAIIFLVIILINVWIFSRRIERTRQAEKIRHKNELRVKEQKFKEESELSERKIEKLKNEKLLTEMHHKDMELANSTMNIIQKNKFLTQLKTDILNLYSKPAAKPIQHDIKSLVRKIDRDIENEKHWQVFDKYFDEVHQDFISRLKEKHPDLTPKDIRMCSYLKMNISSKEIAPLMNISIRGVEISRYRLRKKLNLDRNTNLTEYFMNI